MLIGIPVRVVMPDHSINAGIITGYVEGKLGHVRVRLFGDTPPPPSRYVNAALAGHCPDGADISVAYLAGSEVPHQAHVRLNVPQAETTSPEAASAAGKVLADPTASDEAKTAAASALTQAPDKAPEGKTTETNPGSPDNPEP